MRHDLRDKFYDQANEISSLKEQLEHTLDRVTAMVAENTELQTEYGLLKIENEFMRKKIEAAFECLMFVLGHELDDRSYVKVEETIELLQKEN